MVWARLDDQFHAHPKVAELDPTPVMVPLMAAALGLHMLALSWCADQLTDGFIPRTQPARLIGGPVDNLIEELLRVGLWEKQGRGYILHDYLDYNPSKAQVEAAQKARSEGGKRGARARWGSRDNGSSHDIPHGSSDGVTHGSTYGLPNGLSMGQGMASACPESRIPDTPIDTYVRNTSRAREEEEPVENSALRALREEVPGYPFDQERDRAFLDEPRDPRLDLEAEIRKWRDYHEPQWRDWKKKRPPNYRVSLRNWLEQAEKILLRDEGPVPSAHGEWQPPPGPDPNEPEVPMPDELKGLFKGAGFQTAPARRMVAVPEQADDLTDIDFGDGPP